MKRWIIWGVVVLVVAAVVVVASGWLKPSPNVGDRGKLDRGFSVAEQQTLDAVAVHADELAAATCTDGAKCWIAVDGVVYDMGGFPTWMTRGSHHGVKPGQDDTEAFVKSGHARAVLQKMPVVGSYKP